MDPGRTRLIAVVIVVVVVAAGIGGYVYYRSTTGSTCGLSSSNPLMIDQAETVASADPQTAFSTPEWGLVQQVYQTLIMYNGTSYTTYTGILAKNWTTSADGYHWNFTLNPGMHFSNHDPVTSYDLWFSLYRLLALQGADQYLLSENFWFPGVGYYSSSSQTQSAINNTTSYLNGFNFQTPTSSELAVMGADNQSFRVITNLTIQLNLGFGYLGPVPYTYLLAEMATPGGVVLDPTWVQQNGGVNGPTNSYMTNHALGTGPYVLTSFTTSGYTLAPDPTYWGTNLGASQPWNNNVQPAKASVQVVYQGDPAINVENMKTGSVAAASFAYLGPATIGQLQGQPCVVVQNLGTTGSGASGSWWVYMSQATAPFNNFSVREAVTHAIDYSAVIEGAFGGNAYEWVGPVGFGHPYYNPANLTPYKFNLTQAWQEMNNSPYPFNPSTHQGGYPTTLNFMYLNTGPAWEQASTIIKDDLARIGITINPQPLTLDEFYIAQTVDPASGQCISYTTQYGGPYYMGLDFYASDYISPDDWTQEDAWTYGTANQCMSAYSNTTTMDTLVLDAAGQTSDATLKSEYAQMTELQYANYTNAWLAVPYLFDVYNSHLQGIYAQPMGSTTVSSMTWNTVSAG